MHRLIDWLFSWKVLLILGILYGFLKVAVQGFKEGIGTTSAPAKRENRKHGFAAILSFFIPGLGQFIKGDFLKAFAFFFIGGFLYVTLWWTIIVPLLVICVCCADAYNSN